MHLFVPLVLGVMLHKLRERIERVIERLFFRRQFAAQTALLRLAHESAYMERPDRLIARTLDDIATHVRPTRVAIYRRVDDGYVCARQQGVPDWPGRIKSDDPVFVALRSSPEERDLTEQDSALGRGGVAFPMSVAGRLQGAIVCGDRIEQYTPDERQLLQRVAHDVGAALLSLKARENERLLDALAHGTLSPQQVRQRVIEATRHPRANAPATAVELPTDFPDEAGGLLPAAVPD